MAAAVFSLLNWTEGDGRGGEEGGGEGSGYLEVRHQQVKAIHVAWRLRPLVAHEHDWIGVGRGTFCVIDVLTLQHIRGPAERRFI